MKKCIFTGSGVAIVTPFKGATIDYEKLGELIEFQIKNKTDAIIICGTTGEASTMPDDEHIDAIEYAVKKVNGRLPVIAGTGSNDTRHAIDLSTRAQQVGADAILSVTPYYNKTSQRGLYEHFRCVAEALTIPIILYNVPSRTNLNINPGTLKLLSQIDNIVGVKECNLNQVGETINLCGDDFTIYSGEDGLIVPLMSLGGKGVISVMANIIPADTHDIAANYLSGNVEKSRKLALKTLDLIKALFIDVNPIPIKEAMNLMGMDVGKCRMPLVDMDEANKSILVKAMQSYGLI
ncbi:MAG: 4-hydroxy-tetrahydrodipicolinate synthase [Clostridiaceae bacterium]|jgi:4-hydroxy-tetrahydrodipicolinate synthase|nr:4-hydroxy-tetrahydrodipicolinate synthase [Clostridiaceae bacterium]